MNTPQWGLAWRSPTGLEVHHETMPNYTRERVVTHQLRHGAVAWATQHGRALFIGIDRPAVGLRLLELPRGGPEREDVDPVGTAQRELLEETGYAGSQAQLLGTVWPDSGLLGDGVGVVQICGLVRQTEVREFDDQRWLTDAEIDHEISAGMICDGITLSAIALVRASSQDR